MTQYALSKMEIFETAKNTKVLFNSDENKLAFHGQRLLHVAQGFMVAVLQCACLADDTKAEREYITSMPMMAIGISVHLACLSVIFRTTAVYEFINYFETITNDGKFE